MAQFGLTHIDFVLINSREHGHSTIVSYDNIVFFLGWGQDIVGCLCFSLVCHKLMFFVL